MSDHRKQHPEKIKHSTDQQEAVTSIASDLHRFVESTETEKKRNEPKENARLQRERWTVWGVWLYTILTAVIMAVSIRQYGTARTQMKVQLRGYVYGEPTIDFEVGKPPLYKLSIVNGGQTPVTHIGASLHVHEAPAPRIGGTSAPPPGYAADAESVNSSGDFAFQKKTLDISLPIAEGAAVDQATYDRIFVSGRSVLYIWGRVDFLDIFKDKHRITYCYFFPPPKNTNGQHGVCTDGNDMDSDE